MADPLEFVTRDTKYSVAQMIEDRLSHVLARLFDLGELRPDVKPITEGIRNDVYVIRNTVQKVWIDPEEKP